MLRPADMHCPSAGSHKLRLFGGTWGIDAPKLGLRLIHRQQHRLRRCLRVAAWRTGQRLLVVDRVNVAWGVLHRLAGCFVEHARVVRLAQPLRIPSAILIGRRVLARLRRRVLLRLGSEFEYRLLAELLGKILECFLASIMMDVRRYCCEDLIDRLMRGSGVSDDCRSRTRCPLRLPAVAAGPARSARPA